MPVGTGKAKGAIPTPDNTPVSSPLEADIFESHRPSSSLHTGPANNDINWKRNQEQQRVSYRHDLSTLVREEDVADIEGFIKRFPALCEHYIPVSIIGEGTFSTVYKAIDVRHYEYDNSKWIASSRQDPDDPSRLYTLFQNIEHAGPTRSKKKLANTPLNQLIKDFILCQYAHYSSPYGESWTYRQQIDPLLQQENISPNIPKDAANLLDTEIIREGLERRPPHFVAIKRINSTSGPKRIAEELLYLHRLEGQNGVIPVITADRFEDQVIVVFPFFQNQDFRELLTCMSTQDIRIYMRKLFEALAHIHNQKIIHRDIKPSNFLFHIDKTIHGSHIEPCTNGHKDLLLRAKYAGILVDFGLAQIEETSNATNGLGKTELKMSRDRKRLYNDHVNRFHNLLEKQPPGYVVNDPRLIMRASRAGTRGFRAPEVLFKLVHQTVAIDIWSAGIILLTLLTQRYPFFQSNDDQDAIVEIANIFGHANIRQAAKLYHREWKCNVPSVPEEAIPLEEVVNRLNPNGLADTKVAPPEAFDLLKKCLCLDSTERISAREALKHPFLQINLT